MAERPRSFTVGFLVCGNRFFPSLDLKQKVRGFFYGNRPVKFGTHSHRPSHRGAAQTRRAQCELAGPADSLHSQPCL